MITGLKLNFPRCLLGDRTSLSPNNLLPVPDNILDELREEGIKIYLGSTSKNARDYS